MWSVTETTNESTN